jgi:S-adenosylmethionine decarboxylase
MIVGTEWIIEAVGCAPDRLRNATVLRQIMAAIMLDLGLRSVGEVWHEFPGEGGVTGIIALTESHLACHTYPEHGIATFNLYCCRSRPEWDWKTNLARMLSAGEVAVTRFDRGLHGDHDILTKGGSA